MKSFLLKSLVFVILYLSAQYFYHKYTHDAPATTPLYSKVIDDAYEHAKADIVSFGSSIEYMSHPKEKDRRTMTQRLEGYLPQYKIISMSQAAFTVKLLEPFIKFYKRHVPKDQFYVIELNLDQFSVTDNKRFLDRTPERLNYGENLITALYRPFSIFNYDFGVLTDKEFKAQEIYLQGELMGDFDELYNGENSTFKKLQKDRYMVQYLYDLDNSHPKIGSLNRLIKFLKKENIEALFYITPVDYMSCEMYFDASICSTILNANIKVLTDILDESEFPYLNHTLDLPTEAIATTPMMPNGHLKGEGRDHNAKQISEWIKKNLN